ncbi:MAG: tetratricopeptide repeat protein [Deinococcota bacterium]
MLTKLRLLNPSRIGVKPCTIACLLVFSLSILSTSLAQDVTRVVVLPFSSTSDAAAYSLGLPAALQRTLNVIDGVYVPPVGDAFFVSQRLQTRGAMTAESVARSYDAAAIVSGQVQVIGDQVEVRLGFAGPNYAQVPDALVRASLNDTQTVVTQTVNTVIDRLALSVSGLDNSEITSLLNRVPSFESLGAAGEASSRLGAADLEALATAKDPDDDLDYASSWILSEYARALALDGNQAEALTYSQRAVEYGSLDVESTAVRGVILLSYGQTAEARQLFDEALRLNPVHAIALQGRGRTTDDLQMAQADFEAALRANPRFVNAYLSLASSQDAQQALQTLRAGVERVPESISLHRAIVREAIRLGDPAGAVSYLEGFLANNPEASPDIYALAALVPAGAPSEQALELVRQGRSLYPQAESLVLAEATLLEKQGNSQASQEVLSSAVPNSPSADTASTIELAVTQARSGQFEQARATMGSLGTEGDALEFNIAQVYLQAGQSDAAISILEPLINRNPNDDEALTFYAIALGRAGRYDQALNSLDRALQLNPANEQASRARSVIEQNRNLTGNQAVSLSSDAATAFEAGLSALESGQFSEAMREFDRARSLQDQGLIAFYQGYTKQLLGDTSGAVPDYERALQDLPNSATLLNNLGFAYYRMGRFDRAVETLVQAVTTDPNNVEAQLNLGLVYYDLNRFAQSVAPLEQALALNPELAQINLQTQNGSFSYTELLEDARSRAQ